MKKNFLILFFAINTCFAQQNLFNIPSGQLTPKAKWFYQHQLNAYDFDNKSSKQHFAYGLKEKLEFGVNFLNFNFLESQNQSSSRELHSSPSDKILALTLQTQFFLTSKVSLNVGTQSGLTGIGESAPNYYSFKHYGLFTFYSESSHFRMTGGVWVADQRFNGRGNYTGLMAGGEWMFKDGLYLMGDWVSGTTKNSVSVLGGMVDIDDGIQLCLGYLLPNPNSSEGTGLVFEINLFEI